MKYKLLILIMLPLLFIQPAKAAVSYRSYDYIAIPDGEYWSVSQEAQSVYEFNECLQIKLLDSDDDFLVDMVGYVYLYVNGSLEADYSDRVQVNPEHEEIIIADNIILKNFDFSMLSDDFIQDKMILIDTGELDSGSASMPEAAAVVSDGSFTMITSSAITSSGAMNFNDTDILGTLKQIHMLLFILVVIVFVKWVHTIFIRVFERLSGHRKD